MKPVARVLADLGVEVEGANALLLTDELRDRRWFYLPSVATLGWSIDRSELLHQLMI